MNVILIVEAFVSFILAVTIHGAVQARVARMLGDTSPRVSERLSPLPPRHLSAIGIIVGIVFSVASFGAGLGWGKTLELDARKLRIGPNIGTIVVALSGLLFNALLGIVILLLFNVLPSAGEFATQANSCTNGVSVGSALQSCVQVLPGWALRIEQFFYVFALTNIAIAILNIIPLHPLDGYHVVFALLPPRQAISWRNFAPWMELLLLVIFFVVPVILSFLRVSFSPAYAFIAVPARLLASVLFPVDPDFFAWL
ncbi:MAG: site-2 protease family protein [Nitrososphaerota archaeon]